MEIVLLLLCIAGVSFAIEQTEGPFGLLSKARSLIARIPVVGPMFYEAIQCAFCLGFWVSAFVFCVTHTMHCDISFITNIFVWAFGGGIFNLLFVKLLTKLQVE